MKWFDATSFGQNKGKEGAIASVSIFHNVGMCMYSPCLRYADTECI